MLTSKNKIKIVFLGIILLVVPFGVEADYLGQRAIFNVDPAYDLSKKTEATATLQKITDQLYFYLDDNWWNSLDSGQKQEVINYLSNLGGEFEQKIYPLLTLNFGSEWKPGIDGDSRITILFHPMIEDAGGYFNSADEYSKLQVPTSNQREMIYLNTKYLSSPKLKSFLAHEFTHLITFNQKEKIQGVTEEVWLNEGRAEAASAFLGYDLEYQNSNLERRVKIFLSNPRDSLTEWQSQASDYGALNLFIQYLIDHYGIEILNISLKSKKVGIPSLDEALAKKGFKENFSQIFTDWTIAIFINDCSLGSRYCYLNENLKNLRITPYIYFLPMTGDSTLSTGNLSKEWAGNWQKIIGGKDMVLEFTGSPGLNFKIPYIIEEAAGNYSVAFLKLDQNQKGKIVISDKKISSLALLPSIQTKVSGFSNKEPSYQFFWSVTSETSEKEAIKELLAQIEFLQTEIAKVQAQIAAKMGLTLFSCRKLENNLYYGMKNNLEVRCLQEFLKSQGPEIYPEGLVTGNFLSLTQAAVIRFQEKYAQDVLVPLGLTKGTGFVGPKTRVKVNELLSL